MSHYESDAVLLINGETTEVHVQFDTDETQALKRWYGIMRADEPGLAFKLLAADRALLRMPDGKEAPIVLGGHEGIGGIAFTGSGAPPI
ncbi:hypothetical protein ACFUEN_28925 [Streptomyces griseorubiginosus]|uniref:hypothetical protein n=1 Tax=Streptomyces griseorubiginosus TaxID=67304 RepID=UPI0036409FAB